MGACKMALNVSRGFIFCKKSFVIVVFAYFFLIAGLVHAKDSGITRLQTEHAQNQTLLAIERIEKDDWNSAKRIVAKSKDPLASKIYHWYLLMNTQAKDWTNHLFIRLSHFIRQNPNWPSVRKMIVRAEGVMPLDLSNQEVLAWYKDFPPQTPYGMERYMDAMIIEGRKQQAQEFLAGWWASTLTSRDQQRYIFKKYGGYLTLDAHKKRFDALLHKKHYDSARGIAGVLGQGYPALAEARIALAQNKNSGLKKRIDAVPRYLRDDPGLLYERLRWRRKRNMDTGALEILSKELDSDAIYNRKAWWTERHIMVRRLLEKGKVKEAYHLAAAHVQKEGFPYAQAQWVSGWLALRFVDKPTQAYERFIAMYHKVSTPVSKARASYWAGRAAQAMGQGDVAQGWYKKAAEFQTTFYGQLALAALSKKSKLPDDKLPRLSSSDRKAFQRNELVQTSALFFKAEHKKRSGEFMDAFLKQEGTPKAYRFAAEVLAERGDYYAAVRVAKSASKKELFLTKQSYPTITKQLQKIDFVEWALVHALIRQESVFDPNATSRAGARGLMQLMPSTARHVAKNENMRYNVSWLTDKPKYNMYIGSLYIQQLLERYDNEYPLAIAAYNAGPGRVNSWLKIFGDPRKGDIDILDWIELIPIYETRNYVQRVMEGVYIYRLMLEDIQQQPKAHLHIAFHEKHSNN